MNLPSIPDRLVVLIRRFPAWTDGLVAACIAVAVMSCVYFSWPLDLHTPLLVGGDATSAQYIFKSLLEHGGYARNPDVGAPFGATMYDYPIPEPTHHLFIRFLGLFSKDPFLAFNLFYLISFATTAWAACWALRTCGIDRLLSIAGAVLFAILPYHFFRLGHIFLASYFAAPIFCAYAMRLATYRAPHIDDVPKTQFASLLMLAIAAGSGVYYAYFGCLFIAVGCLLGAASSGRFTPIRIGGTYVATIVAVIAASLLPNALYHLAEGANPLVGQRGSADAEIFGLRIAQLLLPTAGHRIGWIDLFMANYAKSTPLVNENMTAALGLIGSAGFLAALAVFFTGNMRRYPELFAAGALNTAGVLYATIGGFGAIVALLLTPEIRGLNRISVFIAFFSLLAVLAIAGRMLRSTSHRFAGAALAVALIAFAWADEIPIHGVARRNAGEFHAQQEFGVRLQAAVPPNTALFELPYTYFPESPHPLGSYALLAPYLYTHGLRWSFGDMHGRPADLWNEQTSKLSGTALASALSQAGFGAIYIDRRGYTDKGVAIEKELTETFGSPIIENSDRNVAVYRVPAASTQSAPFVVADLGRHWYPWESAGEDRSAWSRGSADLIVANASSVETDMTMRFSLSTLVPRHVVISYADRPISTHDLQPGMATDVVLHFSAMPGVTRVSLATNAAAERPGNGDRRPLAFRIQNLTYGPQ